MTYFDINASGQCPNNAQILAKYHFMQQGIQRTWKEMNILALENCTSWRERNEHPDISKFISDEIL